MYHRVMSPKDADGMANSVDPDQTAQESLISVCTVCPDLTVRKLKIIMVCCVITAYYAGSFQPIMLCHYSLLCSQSMEAPAAERPKQISAKPNNFGTKMFLSNKAHAFGATCKGVKRSREGGGDAYPYKAGPLLDHPKLLPISRRLDDLASSVWQSLCTPFLEGGWEAAPELCRLGSVEVVLKVKKKYSAPLSLLFCWVVLLQYFSLPIPMITERFCLD